MCALDVHHPHVDCSKRGRIARVQRALYFPQLVWALEFIYSNIASSLDTVAQIAIESRNKYTYTYRYR